MSKNNIIWLIVLIAGVTLIGAYIWMPNTQQTSNVGNSPEPSLSPEVLVSVAPTPKPKLTKVPVPLPSGDGRTTFINESVPWSLLLNDASCELKGEIKFLNHNSYDNQDALFIYTGIDHEGDLVFWTVTPQDDISIGPNMFSSIPIPNGESLLSMILPENPKSKQYEITAEIQYRRQVDAQGNFVTEGGNIKTLQKQCVGKTIVVLP